MTLWVVWCDSTKGRNINGTISRDNKFLCLPLVYSNLCLVTNELYAIYRRAINLIAKVSDLLTDTLVTCSILLETRPIDQDARSTLHVCNYHTLGLTWEVAIIVETLTMIGKKVDNMCIVRDDCRECSAIDSVCVEVGNLRADI